MSKNNATIQSAYPSFPFTENAVLPSLSGEGVYWEFPQYEGTQRQYASNGIFMGSPATYLR
jgi:hypothetical protein